MKLNKREFLQFCGFSVVGVSALPLLQARAGQIEPDPKALVGKRWAMVINPGACKDDCRLCRVACDKVHNIPQLPDPKHEVKWIWTEKFENSFPGQDYPYLEAKLKERAIPVLCNHCDNPPCVRVCPTQATFKGKDGIVMMDYHRCIGCRYCVAACPYGSRSFNWQDPRPFLKEINKEYPTRTKGVVEKCTFCVERLAKGQIPACVEACAEKALVFGDLEDPQSEVRQLLSSRYAIRRKPELGTGPQIYYLV